MLSCFFDLCGICDLFSGDKPCPCTFDRPDNCEFYVNEKAVEIAVKRYAVNRAVDKSIERLSHDIAPRDKGDKD